MQRARLRLAASLAEVSGAAGSSSAACGRCSAEASTSAPSFAWSWAATAASSRHAGQTSSHFSGGPANTLPSLEHPSQFCLLQPQLPWAMSGMHSRRIDSSGLASCSSGGASPWPQHQQLRGYRSNKRSMKPLNNTASWMAVQPYLDKQGDEPSAAQPRRQRRLGPLMDTAVPAIPRVPLPQVYRRVGRITGPYALELEKVFGVVEVGGTQFKVTVDDIVFVNQLPGVDVNDVISLDRMLLLGSTASTVIGRPYVPGARVLAAVEEHFRDGKVHVFKKKRRKRYRKYQAPRPNLTTLRILKVLGIEPAPADALALPPPLPIEFDKEGEGKAGGSSSEDEAASAGGGR